MDPVTQGVVGAVFAQSLSRKSTLRLATLAGVVGGMLADTDIFIRSAGDPLLTIEYHRHFTHSLAFIPLGGLLAAAIVFALTRFRHPFAKIYLFATAGYATSGLLDACTSYGTQLLWPFSDARIAWNNIAIIDPVFSLTLLLLLFTALIWRIRGAAIAAVAFGLSYLGLGVLQNHRAAAALEQLAEARGHTPEQLTVHPTVFNLLLWRGNYRDGDTFYVDAVRVSPFGAPIIYTTGTSVKKLPGPEAIPDLSPDSVLAADIRRFRHFSSDYLYRYPNRPELIGDLRYSILPYSATPLWAIEVDTQKPNQHVPPLTQMRRVNDENWTRFTSMLKGQTAIDIPPRSIEAAAEVAPQSITDPTPLTATQTAFDDAPSATLRSSEIAP